MKAALIVSVGTATVSAWFLIAATAVLIFQHELTTANKTAAARNWAESQTPPD